MSTSSDLTMDELREQLRAARRARRGARATAEEHALTLPAPSSHDATRTKRIYDELSIALGDLPDGTLTAWGGDTAAAFARITVRRMRNLAGAVSGIARSVGKELTDAAQHAQRGTLSAHMKRRATDLSQTTDEAAKRLSSSVSRLTTDLRANPGDVAPRLLLTAAAFLTTSGGLDGNGGAPDTDLLFGIDAHRSLMTHSILMGAAIETVLIAAVTLSDRIHDRLPIDHDPLWDQLDKAKRKFFVPVALGAGAGVAYHLAIDGLLQPGAYHGIPFEMPMEGHQALLVGNAAAEALDVKKKAPQKNALVDAVGGFASGFVEGWKRGWAKDDVSNPRAQPTRKDGLG